MFNIRTYKIIATCIEHTIVLWTINPLTTDDRLTLAACYQLAQSILKVGFALAKKVGWGGGWAQREVPCTWQLPWLAREEPWSAVAGPFLALLAQTGSGTTPLAL